ncbi:MAG: cytochrome c biogenesis protein CcsA [Candidatus Methanoperedens sp.]|nr:cytochrome c biogenesis protein CcsA [Candidatus Methanoperedens sp.]
MIGSILLYISILFGLLYLFSLVLRELKESGKSVFFEQLIPHSKALIRAAALSLSAAALLLVYYLLSSDFSIHYVWQYTNKDLPAIYKIAAFWTGEEGSLMFLSWVVFMMALWISEKHGSELMFTRKIQGIVIFIGIIFLSIAALLSPFISSLDAGMTEIPEDGAGLNPLLVNKWMIFHPPGIFIPYGIMVVVFASAIVHFLNGNKEWEEFSRPYGRLAWIILGAGIATGDMWSYEVWEGYWIWDPAFTSILMSWLLFTAYLHAASMYRRGMMKMLAPALAVNSFIFALYSTYIIRSGIIQSAHAFGEGIQTMPLLVSIILLSLAAEGLVAYRYFKGQHTSELKMPAKILTTKNTFYATIILLAGLSFILFWGLTSSILLKSYGASVSIDLYGTWSYPLTLALIAVLGICMLESLGRHWEKGIMLGAAMVVVFLLLKPAANIYTNFSAGVLAFAGVSSMYQIFKSSQVNGIKNKLHSSGPHSVHLGIAVILIGVLMSTYAVSETVLFMKFNEKKTVGGYEIQLKDLAFPVEHKHATAVLTKIGVYNIYKDGILVDSGEARFREIKGEFITEALIYRGLLADVNVRYQGIGTQTPIFISVANVRVIPGMTIIWTGSILVVIGIIPILYKRRTDD